MILSGKSVKQKRDLRFARGLGLRSGRDGFRRRLLLLGWAVVAAGVGYARDQPFAVFADEVEEIGAAVVDFAVDEEVEWSPDYSEVVVDTDERVVDTLFDLFGSGAPDAFGEGVEGHLGGIAVAHEHHRAAGQEGLFDRGCVAFGHAVEHGLYWD